MTTIQKSMTLPAPLERVWPIFENWALYVVKLNPHILSYEVTPPGPLSVGQKVHTIIRAFGRNNEIYFEFTEVIPGKKIVQTHVPSNPWRKTVETLTLESVPEGTLLSLTTEYELKGLLWKIMDRLFIRRAMGKDYAATISNLKSLFETPDTLPSQVRTGRTSDGRLKPPNCLSFLFARLLYHASAIKPMSVAVPVTKSAMSG